MARASRSLKRSGSSSTTVGPDCGTVLTAAPAKPGPGSATRPAWYADAAALARLSAASLSTWPEWPLTHSNFTRPRRPSIASSSAFISSTFFTGWPPPVFQPLRFQPAIHLVTALIT